MLWIWVNKFSVSFRERWILRGEKPSKFSRRANRNSLEFYLLSSVEGIIFKFSFDSVAWPSCPSTSRQLLLLRTSPSRAHSRPSHPPPRRLLRKPPLLQTGLRRAAQAAAHSPRQGNARQPLALPISGTNRLHLGSFAPLQVINCQLTAHLLG